MARKRRCWKLRQARRRRRVKQRGPNLSSHKRARARQLIHGVGARLLFLPPYSPDLNPIEMVFAKIKRRLRSLACRT